MRRLLLALALLLSLAAVAAMLWQHMRFLETRRSRVHDDQPLLHSSEAFHVVTFLQVRRGTSTDHEVQTLRATLERETPAQVVYMGRVAATGLESAQLASAFGEAVDWDAVVLVQYPSRASWDEVSRSAGYTKAFAAFHRAYSHGMERWPWLNLAVPQLLLARRVGQIATGASSHFPFVRNADASPRPELAFTLERLNAQRLAGRDAIVVVNLIQSGTPAQVEADRAYVDRMFGLMAEGGHGPMHMGRAVTLERGARFDQVVLAYYPGIDYFMDMVRSEFYQGIAVDKQLADSQATLTIPIPRR